MSENSRKKRTPESHLIERQLVRARSHAWAGQVTITTDERTVSVPGTWRLDLPHDARPLGGQPRTALPLPAPSDLAAWRDHLVRVVTLQAPGMQLRVSHASDGLWRTLEFAAPTLPPSVVHVDRDGWQALLGAGATMRLSVEAGMT